jgi:hypothetical protein
MSAADFQVIERAHQLCDHAPARELSAEVGLEERARAIFEELLPTTVGEGCLVELGDDETDEPPVIDWQQVAADAWHSEGWAHAAKEYAGLRGRARIDGLRENPSIVRQYQVKRGNASAGVRR